MNLNDSMEGRWLTPDLLGGDITNPQSLNRYAYALNNPTTLTDPLGLDSCSSTNNPDGSVTTNCTVSGTAPGLGGGIGECSLFGCTPNCSIFTCGPAPWNNNNSSSGGTIHITSYGTSGGGSASAPKPAPPSLISPASPQTPVCSGVPQSPLGASATFNTGVVNTESKGMWPATKLAFFYDLFHTGGPFDYKTTYHNQQYVNYGNWNFGYICGANYPSLFCQSAAGTARMWSAASQGQNPFGNGFPLLKSPYGDQAADNQQIRNGAAAQKSGCVQ